MRFDLRSIFLVLLLVSLLFAQFFQIRSLHVRSRLSFYGLEVSKNNVAVEVKKYARVSAGEYRKVGASSLLVLDSNLNPTRKLEVADFKTEGEFEDFYFDEDVLVVVIRVYGGFRVFNLDLVTGELFEKAAYGSSLPEQDGEAVYSGNRWIIYPDYSSRGYSF